MPTNAVSLQTISAGDHFFPSTNGVNVAAGVHDLSVQLQGAGDWQSGAAGRVITLTLQKSTNGGTTWFDGPSGSDTSPHMGKAGALPTILVAGSSPADGAFAARIKANFSAPVTTGFLLTYG